MKDEFARTSQQSGDAADPSWPPAKPPVLTLDVSLYEKYLAESGLTDEQKREFLEALWSIVVGFVDLGFGIHPVQQALQAGACEQVDEKGGMDAASLIPFQQEENGQTQSLHGEIVREFAGRRNDE